MPYAPLVKNNFFCKKNPMKKLILFLLVSFIPLISFAQGKHADPRPMKGLDASKIPVLKSFKDLKASPGALTKNAVQIGNAEFVSSDAVSSSIITKDTKNSSSNNFSLWKVMRSANGTANWMWRAWEKPHGVTPQSVSSPDGLQLLQGLKTALRIADPKSEFFAMSAETDERGCKHLRYGQAYQNVPVWNRDLYIHLDASGEPYIINGTYEPTPKNISVTPTISNPYSIVIAIADQKSHGRWAPLSPKVAKVLGYDEPTAKLVLYPEQNGLRLAYEVSIIPNLLESYFYLIDAASGEIITKIARSCSVVPMDPKMPPITISDFATIANDAPMQAQSGFADASGTDLNGVNQPLRTYQHTDGKYYAIWDLASFNAGASNLPDQPSGGAMTLTLNNTEFNQNPTIFHNTSSNNSWSDPTVVSAHRHTQLTYNYYSNTFGRKAIDDKNSAIVSIIHATKNGEGFDNAFWNGASKVMIYGDGKTTFKPLAGGLDVAGHEMTHGVINNTADLIYQFQSGALNESFADVFGVMVDTRNLTQGEDVMLPGQGTCLRDMNDPANPTGYAHQPAHMNDFHNLTVDQDNGGVHVNSGIPNKACAILINQLGRDKVQRMYYQALTKYLTRNSQFTDCRIAVQSAAKDIFGGTSTEFNAVGPAFDAVGIAGPGTDPNKNDIPTQTGGGEIIAFTNSDGAIGLLNVATQQAGFASSPAAVARVTSGSAGTFRAQLTAPSSGSNLWFINPSGHLCFIEVATGVVKTFKDLNLKADGDLWNAAVSPDESYVALTSSYTNDPNIYIFNGNQIFIQPLNPENTDAGSVATIDFPDVIAWSPNKSLPRISFDAFLSDKLGGTDVNYWSMFEINFDSKRTYDLIPAQPTGHDIGNVAYGNTSPNYIIFNDISAGVEDVIIADFKTNAIIPFKLSQYKIDVPITDADKPSFSPNDHQFVFSSALNSSLLFYNSDKPSNPLSFLQFTSGAVFIPYWFLLGGSAGVHDSKTTETVQLAVYPSIITGTGTVKFDLKSSEEVTLDILNLYGQNVSAIAKEKMEAGGHEIKFASAGLTSGTYFIRLATKNGQAMEKIVVEK